MITRTLLVLALLPLAGCAHLGARQACNITSNPSGASVFLVRSPDEQTTRDPVGTTPLQKWIVQEGLTPGYLRACLEGYEPASWQVPSARQFSHHFELQRTVSAQVAEELATYPKEYVRAALVVLGKCDEVMASRYPHLEAAVAAANTANEVLKLDYSGFKTSALARALDGTIDELQLFSGSGLSSASRAESAARHLISEIKLGLDVR
jgi:hypothetical protein